MTSSAPLRELRPEDIYPSDPKALEPEQLESLWRIFVAINRKWALFRDDGGEPTAHALSGARSSWREFVRLRAEPTESHHGPSYHAEYLNAIEVVRRLRQADADNAFEILFAVGTGGAEAPPETAGLEMEALLHAKHFVVDEFMKVIVVAGGFREFGATNYNGFMAGSRTSRTAQITSPFTYPARTASDGE
jgi:hypothetical protein